jgi:hypothetical protein
MMIVSSLDKLLMRAVRAWVWCVVCVWGGGVSVWRRGGHVRVGWECEGCVRVCMCGVGWCQWEYVSVRVRVCM